MKIYKNKEVIEQEIDNEVIIFVPNNDSVVCIDAVGTKLWYLIENGIEFEDLALRFYDCFAEKPSYDQFVDEIDEVLTSYVKAGLLVTPEAQ